MTRVTSVDAGQVITTGLVNMRRFEQRANETLVLAELLERTVTVTTPEDRYDATVEDVAIEQERNRDWVVVKVFVPQGRESRRFARHLAAAAVVAARRCWWTSTRSPVCSATPAGRARPSCSRAYEDLKAADLAEVIHDLSPKRRAEVAAELDDEKLADVLEELPEDDQVEILGSLQRGRAADVLEAMQPDDAADLLSELSPEAAEQLLQMMEPDDAAPLRRLLTYDENTAGGLMTSEPVILGPEATIAEALAVVRRVELSPALAATVFVCRPPLETPTGKFLGMVHIQRLLRDPPHAAIGDGPRQGRRAAAAERAAGPGHPRPRDVQPGRRARRGRGGPPPRGGHGRRRARPHPARRLA